MFEIPRNSWSISTTLYVCYTNSAYILLDVKRCGSFLVDLLIFKMPSKMKEIWAGSAHVLACSIPLESMLRIFQHKGMILGYWGKRLENKNTLK